MTKAKFIFRRGFTTRCVHFSCSLTYLHFPNTDLPESFSSGYLLQPTITSMASNTGSLFGGGSLGTSTNPQSNSLFGANNSTATPFANLSAPSTQNAQTSSLFGGQSQAQQQTAQAPVLGQTQASNPQQGPSTQPAFFNSLLERGKKRPLSSVAQNSNFEDVPSLQLGLDDIRRKARELGAGGQKDTPNGKNSKA